MAVGFAYDAIFLEHDTGPGHPESAERLRTILSHLSTLESRLTHLAPDEVSFSLLSDIHSEEMIRTVQEASSIGSAIDADTQTSQHSYRAALKAAGAGVTAVDAVVSGEIASAFCALRPPGHHATRYRSMGFCLFNNIALAARYAQECGYEKVLVVDFDVHHGNGTQQIFYDDPSVFYVSTHQYPAYPGSGHYDECGEGEGEGFTRNFPLSPGSGDDDILPIYEDKLPAIAAEFKPDIILVSAGYDLHRADPLAMLEVSTDGVAAIVAAIMECADVPKLFFLEGGYNLDALGECVKRTLDVMLAYDS